MSGGAGDACPPGPELAAAVAALCGPGWRCPGATDDELVGLLGRWAAVESWAAAGRLGVVRELIRRRRDHIRLHGPATGDDLPRAWQEGTGHEVAAVLAVSLPGADKVIDLAWALGARLPRTAALLADGTIDLVKAMTIARELAVLDDEHAALAEALIAADLAGKTPGKVGRLAAAAVCAVDPAGAAKRREYAEREDARVRLWRENTGASALAGYGLPTDAALSANANINARAAQYKRARVSPGARMDQLRVLAFLDILNGITAADRIARAQDQAQAGAQAQDQAQAGAQDQRQDEPPRGQPHDGDQAQGQPRRGDQPRSQAHAGNRPPAGTRAGQPGTSANGGLPDGGLPGDDRSSDGRSGEGAADGSPGHDSPAGERPGSGDSTPGDHDLAAEDLSNEDLADDLSAGGFGGPDQGLAASVNLTLPLATLLGLAERPGEGHGLGPLDPALVRELAAAASRSPHSQWCLTITSPDGYAIGHGCARPARPVRTKRGTPAPGGNRDGPWAFTRRDGPGPPGGFGSWTLTLPGGREFTVKLGPVPVTECDHRYEAHSYQPGDTLRHLMQIRDGTCTFPSCSRHARNCDFEHAIPYDQGGRTCACNGGARSRRCHRVKQSRGWSVSQPRPGWHRWSTPSGRTYTSDPMQYPALSRGCRCRVL